jgi:hypothetical protein
MFKRKTIVVIGLLLIFVCPFIAIAMPQNRTGRFLEKRTFKNEPIEFTHVLSNNQLVKFNQEFFESDNWLSTIGVEISNTSGKSIVCFEVYVEIPGIENFKAPVVIPMMYGYYPSVKNPYPPVAKLQPGESVTLSLPYEEYNRLTSFVQGNISKIKKAMIYINTIYFDDGTAWQAGFNLNPGNPGEWYRDKTQSSKLPQANIDISAIKKAAYLPNTSVDACRYTYNGQRLIDCCGVTNPNRLVPDAQFIYDPAYGNSNIRTITRLCDGFSICYYRIAEPCSTPDPPQS